ncbi:hypothetical protein HMPREF1141_0430 [Clostridium sp. MSTE9]|nr:hypothetical protein HMPREF1141_0430 [Clostridium sp. MSTE9]
MAHLPGFPHDQSTLIKPHKTNLSKSALSRSGEQVRHPRGRV